jgi:O-antigen/teichoic acid export membrane protein
MATSRKTYRKFALDVITVSSANILVALSPIILLPVLTRNLGVDGYGIFVQFNVTIALATPIVMFAITGAMIRFLAGEKDTQVIREGFYSVTLFVFGTGLIVSALLVVFSKFLAATFFGADQRIVVMLALIIPITCLNFVFLMFFRTFGDVRRYTVFVVVQGCAELGLIWYTVQSGHGIHGATICMLAVRGTLFLIMLYMITSKIGFRVPIFSQLNKYLRFSVPYVPANIAGWVINSSDRYLIGIFLGAFFVGVYNPSYSLGNIIVLFITPLEFVLFPTVVKLYHEGKQEEVRFLLHYALKFFLFLAIPAAFGISLLSKSLLISLSTTEIASRGYLITPFVACSALIYGTAVIFNEVIALSKKTRIAGIAWVSASAINLGLNLLFIPWLGIVGAAITTLVAFTLGAAIVVRSSFKYLTFSIPWLAICKSLVASAVMSVFVWAMHPVGPTHIVISIAGGAFIYGVALVLLKGFTRQELGFFREFLRL